MGMCRRLSKSGSGDTHWISLEYMGISIYKYNYIYIVGDIAHEVNPIQ